jgi:plasmid stabilization system protein ParE
VRYKVRYTRAARDDLKRLFNFLADRDLLAAQRAREAIAASMTLLQEFPYTCRKATTENPFVRELIISFGVAGYVALFEIEDDETVSIIAIRHQREDDYL